MKHNHWIHVKNKTTYAFLLSIPTAIIFLIIDGNKLLNPSNPQTTAFITHCFITLLLVMICLYLFIRFNSYSPWYNPNHND